ncbi:MAG: acetyltransferase [Flavobacteriales bacterium]|nr:acetyltransferase [Flavobacteriales bacterium]
MIIIGAKGFAKELLEVCHQLGRTENLVFFDNVSTDLPEQLFGQFPILRTAEDVKQYFQTKTNAFALGLGKPILRNKMAALFTSWGGELTSLISPKANIGSFGVEIGKGATILSQATITSSVKIGVGLLMYPNSIVTHDCQLGDFVELSPGATILGNCQIGDNVQIGANATILPNLSVGQKSVIGAGSVVTKNIEGNIVVKGVPAK